MRDDSMGAFADVVRRTRPDLDPGLVGAAIFGATLVAGLEWLVFQPERTRQEAGGRKRAAGSGRQETGQHETGGHWLEL